MMTNRNTGLCLIVVFLCLLVFFWMSKPPHALHIIDSRSGESIWAKELCCDHAFSIQYTHSVNKSPVTDFFSITGSGELLLFKTAFSSYGAGIPYENNHSFSSESGLFILDNLDIKMDKIPVRISSVSDHRLCIFEEAVYLNDLATSGTLLFIVAK